MELSRFKQCGESRWELAPVGKMRVPGVIFASRDLLSEMGDKVGEQLANVASLPGIVDAAFAMPDAHWGYGFPVGGVAAFDPDRGGIISGGGVGFDISCGVRTMLTGLKKEQVEPVKEQLADALFAAIPAGLGSRGEVSLSEEEMDAMLSGGAEWAVSRGWGERDDLDRIEERGHMPGAVPGYVSAFACRRQHREMGTLGSGNHYCEVQVVEDIFDPAAAAVFGVEPQDVIVTIHCGSRGLGHQIGTEFLREMALTAARHGIDLPDRELACAPINSELGQRYLGAMRAGINCALANRQIISHLVREVFAGVLPEARMPLLYDVSHNTCKVERHWSQGQARELYIHRKGATRAFGPGHPDLPDVYRESGQPVLVGGSMGTESWILAGTNESETCAFSSSCHGAGRRLGRIAARKHRSGRAVVDELKERGILIRSPTMRGVAEEAPEAYKDASAVVEASETAGLARRVARLRPLICIKG